MGADTMILTRVNEAEINCRSNPMYPAEAGSIIKMMFDTSKAVVFDQETGQRLDK
jgi:multiple sugar transport system ATP-binding protein